MYICKKETFVCLEGSTWGPQERECVLKLKVRNVITSLKAKAVLRETLQLFFACKRGQIGNSTGRERFILKEILLKDSEPFC